ncbi:MAG: hypothetical protein AAGH64_10460, partial [Planctomycetota bacterium]
MTAIHTQRLEHTVLYIVLALEVPSVVMCTAILAVSGVPWWVYLITLTGIVSAPVLLLTARLRVRLDDDRLRWSFVPFWRSSVRYGTIEGVEVVEVQAMRDYLGWGPKLGGHGAMKGTFGLVARSGGAIRIQRSDKKRDLVITCDDPDALAADLLERGIDAQRGSGAGA